jgi:hypothetical protein
MKSTIEVSADRADVRQALELETTRGALAGAAVTLVVVVVGACIPAAWRFGSSVPVVVEANPVTRNGPFELSTTYSHVPFIALSASAIRVLGEDSTRKMIEAEMARGWYFQLEELKGKTRYLPRLRDPGNVRSTFIFTNGDMQSVVVQLVNDDGSPGRSGLIPLDEFQDDLRSHLGQ